MTFWFLLLGIPLALSALWALCFPSRAAACVRAFPRSRLAGSVLCVVAWFWTAYEIDALGIDVIDQIVSRLWFLPSPIPGAVWIWALVLSVLTIWWMENLLPLRAACGLAMLMPGELFPAIRLCETSWRLTLVVFAYLCCIAGMWGMFYPWRLRQAGFYLAASPVRMRLAALAPLAVGVLFSVLGALAAVGLLR